ncbi:MAG: translation initiation factor IF-2 [Acidobacteriaceae bacterium]
MSKVRINDLARELEVKSREVLDALPKVGVTEKKTHSSSLEADEAERVRKLLGGKPSAGAMQREGSNDIRPKIDFSKVSKPGDVAAMLRAQREAPQRASAPSPAISAKPQINVAGRVAGTSTGRPEAAASKPAMPPRLVTPQSRPPAAAKPAPEVPAIAKVAPPPPMGVKASAVPQTPQQTTTAHNFPSKPIQAEPSAPPAAPPQGADDGPQVRPASRIVTPHTGPRPNYAARPEPPAPEPPVIEQAAPPATEQAAAPAAPATPVRRIITPQTGPRPVYAAPATPPPGLQRGRPIFERPRPGQGQGARPGYQGQNPNYQGQGQPGTAGVRPPFGAPAGPGGMRRGPHPTRTGTGAPRPGGFPGRPGMGAPGMLPPPPTGAPDGRRPAGNRRPGQRYEPRGVKEGPMKGFNAQRFQTQQMNEPVPITRTITISEGISVKDLAEKLDVRAKEIISRLLMRGVMATVNQTLDADLAREIARFFGADTNVLSFEEQMAHDTETEMLEAIEKGEDIDIEGGIRAPVVTVMGHVDHGKTSLLDAIRETEVAAGEAGGITQHIGAYKVKINDESSPAFGREIVFLDTPGHEAFTRMRARGAKVTDIVVIVVAADDGVMPQTLEAVDHATAAKVPIIVAVNKIDKPDAQPERVKKQLADRGLVPEDWGGSTVYVEVSAKKKTNLNLLMENICLVSDVGNFRAFADRAATGHVLEAKLDRGRGVVADILIQQGTLHIGEAFIVGNTFGKVRAMFDDRGNALEQAGPSTPIELLGLEGLPAAGDQFQVLTTRDKAKSISQYRGGKAREAQLAKSSRVTLEGLSEQIKNAGMKELQLILKGDVGGSVEVLADSLQNLSNEKVRVKILRSGVGAITESDVLLATASDAVIIGFNVRPERKAQETAEQEGVDIRLHSIIYELQDEIKLAMAGLLDPIIKETYIGRAEVRQTFKVPKLGTIAGCSVQDGIIRRDSEVKLMRGGAEVFKGKVGSLKRFKDDASEVRTGMECGIAIAGYGDIHEGDVIEAFRVEKVAATLA